MDIDTLRTKRDEVSKRFDQLQTVATKQKQDGEAELFRLQGEFRLLDTLIDELKQEEKPQESANEDSVEAEQA